jgi:hypothetical protein
MSGVLIIEVAVGRFNSEASTSGHGVARIDGKIDDSVLKLSRVDIRGPETSTQNEFQLDRLAHGTPQ